MRLTGKNINYKIIDNKQDNLSILTDISFIFESNDIVLILGPSGSGKTTLIKLISSFGKLQNDDKILFSFNNDKKQNILLKRKTKTKDLKKIRRNSRITFQNINLQIFKSTVKEEIIFSIKNLSNKKLSKVEINKIFTQFVEKNNYSEKFLNQSMVNLSEGEKRILIISCCLFFTPKLLILDEPTINLDYKNKQKIISHLINIKKQNNEALIILVTHDLQLLKIASRVLIINNGIVKFFGKKQLLLEQKKYLYENDLLILGYNDEYFI